MRYNDDLRKKSPVLVHKYEKAVERIAFFEARMQKAIDALTVPLDQLPSTPREILECRTRLQIWRKEEARLRRTIEGVATLVEIRLKEKV